MADKPLGAALTSATYEFLGSKHRDLLDNARRESPGVHGVALATKVLGMLQPELALEAGRVGEKFFKQWVSDHGGKPPRIRTKERDKTLQNAEGEKMEMEDLKWVGLAALIAFVGGALVLRSRKRNDDGPASSDPRPQRSQAARPQKVLFAAAVFSGKVRNVGANAASAGDVLTQAAFWWVGRAQIWDGVAQTAGLSAIDGIPDTDDALLVLVYEVTATDAVTPSSRPEGAKLLREASRSGEIRLVETFATTGQASLIAAGFRR